MVLSIINSAELQTFPRHFSITTMAFFSRVIRAMEKISPISLAENSWDNVGKLIEPPYPRPSSRVFLTIDLTPSVLEEALSDKKVGVIIAYHPPIFRPFKKLNLDDIKQT